MADRAAPLLWSAFDASRAIPPTEREALLGGKGAGLVAMTELGLPVPPGFTLTTLACRRYLSAGWTDDLEQALTAGLRSLEAATGRRLGDVDAPLVVSVRSGAPVSMPGMMDTVLDVGLTPAVAEALGAAAGDPGFGADTLARARAGFIGVVGTGPPDDPAAQVHEAARAVFESWRSTRAGHYREIEGIDDHTGTAVTVQAMVHGNLGVDSGTGVAFSRDPSTGAAGIMGDFLVGAQGEDVVAGDHATLPLADLAVRWPAVWEELVRAAHRLEHHFADMVDIEFTVERGRLWLLQVRPGKRSRGAAARIAVEQAEDPSFPLDRAGAVRRCAGLLDVPAGEAAVRPGDPPSAAPPSPSDESVLCTGLAGSPGRASGAVCLDVDRAVELEAEGVSVVLVRHETSPADVHGMAASVGLITTLGGLVSHAAVVARSWGIPAVVGATDLRIGSESITGPGGTLAEGELVTVDGDRGVVLVGRHDTTATEPAAYAVLRGWRDELDRPG